MDAAWLRRVCLALPYATERIQWEVDLVFKVGGKMFAVAPLEPAKVCLSFKCSSEDFHELAERPGIIPAPYLARAQWVALQSPDALAASEVREYLKKSHALVFAKLPKKTQQTLAAKQARRKR